MADTMGMRGMNAVSAKSGKPSIWTRPWLVPLIYSLVVILALLFLHRNATDYVGADNDDAMRLVEVRDLLGGQGWFDMMQYRLGLDGGTLMHWSRFIDLPIASLIAFFGLFLSPQQAEAVALTVWPLSLVLPLMFGMGLVGYRTGGIVGLHISLGLTALTIVTSNRFLPGSIDHDNVQLGLVAIITAMLVDEKFRPVSFAIAGFAAALAVGIGVETTPFVAVACLAVAVLWAWEGALFAPAACAFALTLTIAISAAFFSTVPPHLYSSVTCDNLSLGFYGITSVGGGVLLVSAFFASRLPLGGRFAVLAAGGVIIAATTLVLAPQCLRSPLADLDPMLMQLWLHGVTEAQSILSLSRTQPDALGAFYAAGLLGCTVCLFRMIRGDRARLHAVLLALLLVNWAIALVQVRGALFANLLSIPPLTLLLIDLKRLSNADSEDIGAAFFYVFGTLASVPAVWAVGGTLVAGHAENAFTLAPAGDDDADNCSSRQALAPIIGLDPAMVAASSNMGSPILRFTRHSVISAPYHRDQGGMLTEMHIGLAEPPEAEAFLRGAHVTLLAYCKDDPQTEEIAKLKPDGLYAQLGKGNIPPFLEPLPAAAKSPVRFFRFKPQG